MTSSISLVARSYRRAIHDFPVQLQQERVIDTWTDDEMWTHALTADNYEHIPHIQNTCVHHEKKTLKELFGGFCKDRLWELNFKLKKVPINESYLLHSFTALLDLSNIHDLILSHSFDKQNTTKENGEGGDARKHT
jgi:hypothetical protein